MSGREARVRLAPTIGTELAHGLHRLVKPGDAKRWDMEGDFVRGTSSREVGLGRMEDTLVLYRTEGKEAWPRSGIFRL